MTWVRTFFTATLLTICVGSSQGQTPLTQILTVASRIGSGYNVSQSTQAQLDRWLINEPAEGFVVTSYRNEIVRFPSGSFQTGTLHVVLTLVVDGKLTAETITIDSKSSGGNPDNGVRVSTNSVSIAISDLARYQSALAAVQAPASGFTAFKVVPYDFLTFKGTAGTVTLGPNQAFGGGGTSASTYSTADINTPLGFFIKLTWDSKTP